MAKEDYEVITKSGRTYNYKRGARGDKAEVNNNYSQYITKINGSERVINIPYNDMKSLTDKEVQKLINETARRGRRLTDDEVSDIVGGSVNKYNKLAYYDYLLDNNADKFGFDSSGEAITTDAISDEDASGIAEYKQALEDNLMADARNKMANNYRNDMYGAINAYEQSVNATQAASELDAYKMLGQQQLELENNIAAQRMQSLKSGVTSAQLASQELANMFSAQSGAAQVANSMAAARQTSASQFAQQRAGVESSLYDYVNQNQNTLASAYASLGAAQASYNSYPAQVQEQWKGYINAIKNNYMDKQ